MLEMFFGGKKKSRKETAEHERWLREEVYKKGGGAITSADVIAEEEGRLPKGDSQKGIECSALH